MKARYYCLLLLSFFSLSAQAQTPPDIGDESTESTGYFLVWSDEFDGTSLNTTDNWFRQTQLPTPTGWFNGEEQHYTSVDANSSVTGGNLSITAIKETLDNQGLSRDYTSARLNSKFSFTYGRVDVRAQMPADAGTWPAIWMLGTDIDEDGGFHDAGSGANGGTAWPAIGEIDILEQFADKQKATSAIHTTRSSGDTENKGDTDLATATTAFHVYSIIWDKNEIEFLVDDVAYWTYNPVTEYGSKTAANWPFESPQYLLLNLAMGGIGGTIDPAFTSASMDVDYVRVYQQDETILDFENSLTGVTESSFTNGGGISGQLISNVVSGGINMSANVYKIDYEAANDWWAGVGFKFANNVLDDETNVYKAKLYSTVAPTNVLFQVEVDGTNQPVGNVQPITSADEWVELTFTLPDTKDGANRILIRPDVGTEAGTKPNTGTLYVDDIRCVSCTLNQVVAPISNGSELVVNGGFETGLTQTNWEFIDQGGTISITDSEKRDGMYAALIVADVAANSGGGSFPVMQQVGFGSTNVSPGDKVRVTFNIKAVAGTASPVYKAALFSNKADGAGSERHEITMPTESEITGNWQTVTADITTDPALDPANGLSIQFQADCGSDPNCSADVYIDNVSVFVLGNIDTERPVITLTGGSAVDLTVGTTYVDPGFSATDNIDGDISANVVVGGQTVDKDTEGSYEIRYSVSDAEGNAALEATRIVTVVPAGVDVGPSLIANGGFETGDLTSWVPTTHGGTIVVIDTDKNGGTYSVQVKADVDANSGQASFPVLNSAAFAQNQVNPGDEIKVTFDIKGSSAGVPKAALFSNKADGAVRHEITLPTFTGSWQAVTANITTDAALDVNNGLTLQFQADCGSSPGCILDMLIDNISVSVVDNGGGGGATAPTDAPTTPPMRDAADVISLFSNTYTDVTVDTWLTNWSAAPAATEDVQIASNTTKKYTGVTFVGIETVANQIDASGMTHFHIDYWSANGTEFRVKLVDAGANGTLEPANAKIDDKEHELTYATPAQGQWVSYDIPLSDFTDLTTTSNIAQLILAGKPEGSFNFFIDNVYFYTGTGTTTPVGTTLFSETFDASSSITGWESISDALKTEEASIDWTDEGGSIGGTMELSGYNDGDPNQGRSYIWQELLADGAALGILTATEVEFSVDLKLGTTALNNSNIEIAWELDGSGTNTIDVDESSLSATGFTTITLKDAVDKTNPTWLRVSARIAPVSAASGEGANLIVDNIKLVDPDGTGGGGGTTGDPLKLPITFDVAAVDYLTNSATESGTTYTITDNDVQGTGHDVDTKVAKLVTSGTNFDNVNFTLDEAVDLSTEKRISLKFYSTKAVETAFKFESGLDDAPDVTVSQNHGGGGWESLNYDFYNASGTYNKIVVFTALEQEIAGTFYIDDIEQKEAPPLVLPDLPVTFESDDIDYEFSEFFGSPSVRIDNPVPGTGNTSGKVVKTTKNQDAVEFAGTFFSLAEPIDFSTGSKISMNIYSPKSDVKISMKLENATNGGISQETANDESNPIVANQWQTIEFDFSNLVTTEELSKIVLVFDDDVEGDGSEYYWDDIELIGDAIVPPSFPVDFESNAVTYNFLDFDGQGSEVVSNPAPTTVDGVNSSPTVVRTNKGVGAATFAGTALGFNAPIDFSTGKTLSIKSYSPKVGVKVVLKLENRDDDQTFAEVETLTTVENEWEELVFDFTGEIEGKSLSKAIVFFDFGVVPTEEATYYWDELQIRPLPDEENAFLSDISVDGVPLAVFDPDVLEYRFVLPENATAVPQVTFTKAVAGSTTNITQANNTEGIATIEVTSEDGNTTKTYEVGFVLLTASNNLVANGDFEEATNDVNTMWYTNYPNGDIRNQPQIETEGTPANNYFTANVQTATNAFRVNMSQGLAIEQDKTYILTFDASTGIGSTRTMLAGIGLNIEPFTNNRKEVTLTDQTQTFTLLLTATGFGNTSSRVLFDMGADVGDVVIDNVSLIEQIVPPILPTDAPTEPTFDAQDVVAIWSDQYGDRLGTNFRNEGAAQVDTVDLNGNDVLKYTRTGAPGGNYAIIKLSDENIVDMIATGMTNLRVDMWFPREVTPSSFILFNTVNQGVPVSQTTTRIDQNFSPAMSQGQWITYDFNISDLINYGMTDFNSIQLFVIDINFGPEVYIDNLLFYKKEILQLNDATLSEIQVSGQPLQEFNPALFDYSVELSAGTTAIPTVTATATTLDKADVVVNATSTLPGTTSIVVTAEDGTTEETYEVKFFVDTPPTAGPNAPTELAPNVLSLFSDTYDDVANEGLGDGALMIDTVSLGGNDVMKFTPGGNTYKIIEFGEANELDLFSAGITNFRFDVWFSKDITSASRFLVKLEQAAPSIATGTIQLTSSSTPTMAQGQWITYDLALTDLSNLTSVRQVVIDIQNVGEAYIDNMYFYGAGPPSTDNLLANGDFEGGTTAWSGNAFNVVTEGGNSFNFADTDAVTSAFEVNLSQTGLSIVPNGRYTMRFTASTSTEDQSRTIVTGIGLSASPFNGATQTITLTPLPTEYTLDLTAYGPGQAGTGPFGGDGNSRVLFDMGADIGVVVIDDVSLQTGANIPSSLPTLNDLQVNGETIEGFNAMTEAYQVELPFSTSELPVVAASTTNPSATIDDTQADAIDGIATILVRAEDGETTKTYTIDFSIGDPSDDATLSDLKIGENSVDGFLSNKPGYTATLPSGSTLETIPEITAVTNNEFAQDPVITTVLNTEDEDIFATTTIVITAEDDIATETYKIDFSISTEEGDATLSDLQIDFGTVANPDFQTVDGFNPVTLDYDVALPFGTDPAAVPAVQATPTFEGLPEVQDDGATVVINDAAGLPGTTNIKVTSFDESNTQDYTIAFTIAEASKDSTLTAITIGGTAVAGFDPETFSYDFVLPAGTNAIPAVIGTPSDDNAQVVVTTSNVAPGLATLVVTAQNGTSVSTYTVKMTVANDPNLLVNGNFEFGQELWAGNAFNVQTEGGNSFNFADVATAGDAFAVSLAQTGLTLETGEFYTLAFNASTSDRATRSVVVGLGPVSNPGSSQVREVNLTENDTRFSLVIPASFAAGIDDRVFFDMGAAIGVVVIDNVSLTPAKSISFPVTFEADDVAYELIEFGGAPGTVQNNPSQTGINTSAKAAQTEKVGSAEAGTFFQMDDPIDFSAGKVVFMKVYSPKADINVRLRLENATDTDNGFELTQTVATANEWVELSYDFTDDITNESLSKVILVFDPDNNGDGSKYFWDDISLVSPRADATLSSITVNDEPIDDFTSSTLIWEVEIPFGTTTIPTVTATANSVGADVEITQTPNLADSAKIIVTSIDQANTNTYYVKFKIGAASDDPTLTDIKVDDLSIAGFRSDSLLYIIELPSGTTDIPQITEATVSNDSATFVITQAPAIPDTARVVVTAQSDSVLTYKVVFKELDANVDATLSDLRYGTDDENISIPNFSAIDTAYTVVLPFGADVPKVFATASNADNATVDITQITSLPGRATVVVTAANGTTKKTYIVDFSAPNTDATLSDLRLGAETVDGFLPEKSVYKVTLPFSAQDIPATTATATDVDGASVDIEIALTPEDSTFVVVTAEDGTTVNKYIIAFEVAPAGTDATLKELLVDGNKVADFIPSELTYTVVLSEGTTIVPTVAASATDENASMVVTQTTSFENPAMVAVTSEDGATTNVYSVTFEVSDNKAPIVTSRILDQSINLDNTVTFTLSTHFNDPEGLDLIYSVDNLRDEIVRVSIENGVLTVVGIAEGTSNIEVTAADDINGTATMEFDITVVGSDVTVVSDIAGQVTADGNPFTEGRAVMFDVNNINNAFSSELTAQGGFAFSFVPEGSYYLYVTSTSPDYVTTVYGDVSTVLDANALVETLEVNSSLTGLQISMVDKPTPAITFLDKETGGTLNFNTRSVTESGSRVLEGNSTEGDVLPGVIVILQTLQGEYIADGVTDESGHIQFIGLPTGSYNLVVDVPGVGRVTSEIAVEEGKQAYYTGLIDEDGIAVNIATGIDDELLKAILLYPTKAERELYIDLPAPILQQFELNVTSMSGRQITPNYVVETSRIMIQVDQLSAGLHIITIITKDGSWSGKFIKQ